MTSFVDVGQPNSTLYIQNLNERISLKYLIPEVEKIFGEYGEVISVVAKRRVALRGQAFVLFQNVEQARAALEVLQGERLYGKSMVIKYAKYKSDVISKADGTFEIERRRREQDRSKILSLTLILIITFVVERARHPRMTRRQMLAQMAANPAMQGAMLPMAGLPMSGPTPLQPQMVGGELQLPNKVLYLQGLPDGTKESQLGDLFKRFPGFVEIRLVPNRPDVAFAEYEHEMQAVTARQAVDGVELQPGTKIRVAFARR
jgi:RNA recognition motif-containing protein